MTLAVMLFGSIGSSLWEGFAGVVVSLAVGFAIGRVGPPFIAWLRRRGAIRVRVAGLELQLEAAASAADAVARQDMAKALDNIARDPLRGPRLYITELDLTAFRCISAESVTLHYPRDASTLEHPNINLILGDNGSGKSTFLKAIAIAALGPILDSSGFVPYHLIRIGQPKSSLLGTFVLDEPTESPRELPGGVNINRVGDYERLEAHNDPAAWAGLFDESDPAFLVVGYGVNRRTADDESEFAGLERSRRRRRYQRVASLFEESTVLTPLSSWLPSLSLTRRLELEELLESLLPTGTSLIETKAAEPIFRHRGMPVPYRALSDGYKSFIGWVGDLLFQIESVARGELPFTEVGGIVLVDEVDLLLHPSWQRVVVPKIARALPNLQFVFTTHSPIVAGTVQAGNILVAREGETGASRLVRVNASIHGLNAEQILLSSYFDMKSTRAPGVQSELSDLARRAMEGDDEAAVTYLRTLAGDRPAGELKDYSEDP